MTRAAHHVQRGEWSQVQGGAKCKMAENAGWSKKQGGARYEERNHGVNAKAESKNSVGMASAMA